MTATTPPGAAEDPARRGSRAEMLDSINERHFKKLQNDGVDVTFTPEEQLDSQTGDDDDDDAAAEAERKRLETEAAAAEAAEQRAGAANEGRVDPNANRDEDVITIDESSVAKYKIRGKVNGQETDLDLSQVIPLLQKKGAADALMRDAVEAKRQADAAKREADELLAVARANPGDEKAKQEAAEAKAAADKARAAQEQADKDLDKKLRDATTAMFSGDVDSATSLLKDVFLAGRPAATLPDADDLVERVAKQVKSVVKHELSAEAELAAYAKAYPDVANNPLLANVADKFFDDAIADKKSVSEALTYAGDKTRAFIKEQAAALGMTEKKADPISERSERLKAKKEGMDTELRAAGTPVPTGKTPAPVEGNHRADIADMAAQRSKGRGF
jgi:hypothetical protein